MSKKTPKTASTPDTATQPFIPDLRLAILCAVLAFILYANTIANGYVLDDAGVITGNEFVQQGFGGIGKLLTTEVWHFQNASLGYYRPLSLITFAVEQQLFGGNPHISHLINVFLYALTAFVLCVLLMRVFNKFNPLYAALVTIVFIAHPIHTEVVANIKSRDELLAFLNLIVALYAVTKTFETGAINYKWLVATIVFFYLALLSKESAMVGVLIVPVLLYFTGTFTGKQIGSAVAILAIVLVIYQLQKAMLLGGLTGKVGEDLVNYPYASAESKSAMVLLVFAWCAKMLLLPYPLVYSYAYNQIPVSGGTSVGALLGLAISAAMLYVIYKGIKLKTPIALGLVLLLVFVLPSLGFVYLRGGVFAERFLYAPVLGFAIVLVWVLASVLKFSFYERSASVVYFTSNKAFTGTLLILTLVYSTETVARNINWSSDLSLVSHDVKYAPENCQVHLHYGTLLMNNAITSNDEKQRVEGFAIAASQLQNALRIYSHFPEAYYQIGQGYQKLVHNPDSAVVYYNNALRENPGFVPAYIGLATLYESTGNEQMASYYYNKAFGANPRSAEIQQYRQRHRKRTGLDVTTFPGTVTTDNTDITVPGKDAAYYNDMGKAYGERGDYANAVRYLQKSLELQPGSEDALVNLSVCYAMMRDYPQSIAALEQVLQVNPNNVNALTNIAIMYNHVGDKARADVYTKRLQEIKNQQ